MVWVSSEVWGLWQASPSSPAGIESGACLLLADLLLWPKYSSGCAITNTGSGARAWVAENQAAINTAHWTSSDMLVVHERWLKAGIAPGAMPSSLASKIWRLLIVKCNSFYQIQMFFFSNHLELRGVAYQEAGRSQTQQNHRSRKVFQSTGSSFPFCILHPAAELLVVYNITLIIQLLLHYTRAQGSFWILFFPQVRFHFAPGFQKLRFEVKKKNKEAETEGRTFGSHSESEHSVLDFQAPAGFNPLSPVTHVTWKQRTHWQAKITDLVYVVKGVTASTHRLFSTMFPSLRSLCTMFFCRWRDKHFWVDLSDEIVDQKLWPRIISYNWPQNGTFMLTLWSASTTRTTS